MNAVNSIVSGITGLIVYDLSDIYSRNVVVEGYSVVLSGGAFLFYPLTCTLSY